MEKLKRIKEEFEARKKMHIENSKLGLEFICAECGSTDIVNENLVKQGFRECKRCGQEWWTDVDYSDTIPKILKTKQSLLDRQNELMGRIIFVLSESKKLLIESGYSGTPDLITELLTEFNNLKG